jgi:hypothetical protein
MDSSGLFAKLNNIKGAFLFLFVLLVYLNVGIGIHSDDFDSIWQVKEWNLYQLLTFDDLSSPIRLFFIPDSYYQFFQFRLYGFETIFYDWARVITSFFVVFMTYRFATIYLSETKAFVFALIFIFFPTHDATFFWFTGQYMMITAALLFYAYYLIEKNKSVSGCLLSLLGAFSSYASVPIATGLSLMFLYNRKYKKFLLFTIPFLIYVVYYLTVSSILSQEEFRTKDLSNMLALAKQYLLQILTSIDALIGPSLFFKIYYSLGEISGVSIVIGVMSVAVFYMFVHDKNLNQEKLDKTLLVGGVVILLSGYLIFAITGLFPQIAFNLGNRVTFFGSFVVVLLLVTLVRNRILFTLFFGVFIFSLLGVSDHWKNWNTTQLKVINNITNNQELKDFDRSQQLFVSHHQYSKLGEISHIEFFVEGVGGSVFNLAGGKGYKVSPMNHRFYYENDELIDKKYGTRFIVDGYVWIYDSKENVLSKIEAKDINNHIASLPQDNRHWVQMLDEKSFLMQIVLKLMPRLKYAI